MLAPISQAQTEPLASATNSNISSYQRLETALERYRAIAVRGGWPQVVNGPALKLNQSSNRIPVLRRRLQMTADLSATNARSENFDLLLEQAVRHFQTRHGLLVDGIVGPQTLRALNTPVTARLQQIMTNLARWRTVPSALGDRYLAVNVAAATLELVEAGRTTFSSKVIVGSIRNPTPTLSSQVETVIFNPPWTVPHSIAVNEILPLLKRNRRYLRKENMIILGRRSDPYGLRINWHNVSARHFGYRLQQKPGANNALGRIKFDFRNRYSVYLHDTPTKKLFAKPARFFSHGCVRVARPHALAERLLAGQGWNRERIAQVIDAGTTQRVTLTQTLPVHFFYWTAFVDEQGLLHFRDDVYSRDRHFKPVHITALDQAKAVGECSG